MPTSAIITGTGIYDIDGEDLEAQDINTQYGIAKVYISKDKQIVFMNRHNIDHSIPPHKINYRANIMALKLLGVENIIAAFAVGSINLNIKPGELVVLDDFLDLTCGRESTFFNGDTSKVVHVDMSFPFCPILSKRILDAAPKFALNIYPQGTYACTNGPRLETPAEIRMLRNMGSDVVGMTCLPEVTLAKELDMSYAAVGLSINWAAGIQNSKIEFVNDLEEVRVKLCKLFIGVLENN